MLTLSICLRTKISLHFNSSDLILCFGLMLNKHGHKYFKKNVTKFKKKNEIFCCNFWFFTKTETLLDCESINLKLPIKIYNNHWFHTLVMFHYSNLYCCKAMGVPIATIVITVPRAVGMYDLYKKLEPKVRTLSIPTFSKS